MQLDNARVVHVFGQTPHHYRPMRDFFSNVAWDELSQNQQFWVWLYPGETRLDGFWYYEKGRVLFEKMKAQSSNTLFVFHGMFERQIWPYLVFSKLTERCVWVCWGAELLQHQMEGLPWKRRIMNFCHRRICQKLMAVYSLNDGDAGQIRQLLYRKSVVTLPYPLLSSQLVDDQSSSEVFSILVGNSGAPTNNHIALLHALSRFKDEDIELVCPLSYAGSKDYINNVIETGKSIFGDRFVALTEMLSKQAYDRLLARVDCAVFNHDRQQGLYVVYSMMRHGKRMFLNRNTSTYQDMTKLGFDLCATNDLGELTYADFSNTADSASKRNRALMEDHYSESALLPRWRAVLQQLCWRITQTTR